jgi:pSer/pThr/pTyr-binding forkhead associated (FHA) protein
MTPTDNARTSDQMTAETTAALQADHLAEPHTPTPTRADAPFGVDKLPIGAALLVVKRGPNVGFRYVLDQPSTSAGRHPGSDIFLDDITVSRHHAEFRFENGQFSIVDTCSLNGTYVNHQPVESAVLANGDEIQLGNFRLVFMTVPAMR